MIRIFCSMLFLLSCNICFADNQIVAIVDKEIITKNDLDERIKATLESNPAASKVREGELLSSVLNSMINEKVFVQEAQGLGIDPSKKEIEDVIRNIEKSKGMKKGNLLKDLASKGLSTEAFLGQLKTNIIWDRLLSQVIAGKIEVSNQEVLNLISNSKPEKVYMDAYIASVETKNKSDYRSLKKVRNNTKYCSSLDHIRSKEISVNKITANLQEIKDLKTKKILSDMQKGEVSTIYDDLGRSKFAVVCNKRYDMNTTEMSAFDNMIREKKIAVQADYYMQNLKKKKFIEIYDF
jgi:parvulin-like peptidyl-prolyl isomerase